MEPIQMPAEVMGFRVTQDGVTWSSWGVFDDTKRIGGFRLVEFPYPGQAMISCDVWLNEEYRGRGLGRALLRARIAACQAHPDISALVATVNNTNEVEKFLLLTEGFVQVPMRGTSSLWYRTFEEATP